jgi:glycosyltransferase involved in cell wall biosynthesis
MWPWLSRRLDRWLNRRLLTRQLSPLLAELPVAPVAITTLPVVADLMGALPVAHWVYYCVDDFGEWPGLDQATLRLLERRVVERADVVVAAGEHLQARLARMGRRAELLTHGVDVEWWRGAAPGDFPKLKGVPRPWVVFYGVIDRRMDVGFVRRLAEDLGRGTVLLVGPEADPDAALLQTPGVVRVPPMPFERLPGLAAAADVLVMPYADLPVTRAMQPLKLKEYLAAGKPVVVRRLPATVPWADCLDLADTPASFSEAVRLRLRTGVPAEQRAGRERLSAESWGAKAEEFARLALAGARSPRHGASDLVEAA